MYGSIQMFSLGYMYMQVYRGLSVALYAQLMYGINFVHDVVANHIDTTIYLPPPANPGPVGNTRVSSASVDQLTVTWSSSTTGGVPTSYNVSINDSSSPVVIPDKGTSLYTHTFTGLNSDTLYTVSMVAINCAGTSNVVTQTKSICTCMSCNFPVYCIEDHFFNSYYFFHIVSMHLLKIYFIITLLL